MPTYNLHVYEQLCIKQTVTVAKVKVLCSEQMLTAALHEALWKLPGSCTTSTVTSHESQLLSTPRTSATPATAASMQVLWF